jgi:signal transduction histidine kinase
VRPLPTSTEVVLLRNHAGAHAVAVRLRYDDDAVRLEITDDGAGFDTTAGNEGYGLQGMRDRLRQAGGTVRVRSTLGAGTAISAEVPG